MRSYVYNKYKYGVLYYKREPKVFGISGSLIWSKTLIELIFNPCGEFRWSPEGPVSQIHSPHLHVRTPGIFSDLLRSVQILKKEWGAESNGKIPHLLIPSRTAALALKIFGGRPAFCILGSCAYSEGPALRQYTLMMILLEFIIIIFLLFLIIKSH